MIKSELIHKIASTNPHLYHRDVERIVKVVFDEIVEALSRGDRVELRGFGAFTVIRRQHAGRIELGQRFFGDPEIDAATVQAVCEEQRGVGDDIDDARDAAAAVVNQPGHVAREFQRRADRRPLQPMIDVVRCFIRIERLQVIAHRNPLAQLLELRQAQLFSQLRLPDHDDLNQLGLLGLEIRQHANLFERCQ